MTDLKQEMWRMSKRVDQVEGQVTKQMQQTINMLDEITVKHAAQGEVLQQLQEANREVTFRLERREKGGRAGSSTAGSTMAPGETQRKPALIIGGWDPDQEAALTKEAATDILRSVEAPIPTDGMFVPGVRRGYAILPIDDRVGESFEQRRQRIQEVIAKVRGANLHLGQRPDGTPRRVWIAMSQPPDRRRRARLAAKVKRLFLTAGGGISESFRWSSAPARPGCATSRSAPPRPRAPGGRKRQGLDGWTSRRSSQLPSPPKKRSMPFGPRLKRRSTEPRTAMTMSFTARLGGGTTSSVQEGSRTEQQPWTMTWNIGGSTAAKLLTTLTDFAGGGSMASTAPWHPPSQFPSLTNGGTITTNLDVSQTSSERGGHPSDNDDGGSHRCRRIQGAHYGRHGPY